MISCAREDKRIALFGLHQSVQNGLKKINRWLTSMGFVSTQTEPCLYVFYKTAYLQYFHCMSTMLYALQARWLFVAFNANYDFNDGNKLHSFLGVQVEQSDN